MSWFPELVVGTLSGVISGLVLQKIAPVDSGIVLSSDESLSMVNQQIVNVGDGAVTIVGDRNYTHIGDDNSVYVTVSPQRVSNEQTDNGDAVSVLMGTFIALVVVSVLLVKNYELILGILIGLSSALLVLSLIMFVLAIRAQFVSSSLKSALLMSVWAL